MDIEDLDAVISPLALVNRRRQMQERLSAIDLTDLQKSDLVRMAHGSEYEALLTLIESIVIISETEHFRAWKEPAMFERTGLVAVAERMLFEKIQKRIHGFVTELQGEQERIKHEAELKKMSPAELLQNSI